MHISTFSQTNIHFLVLLSINLCVFLAIQCLRLEHRIVGSFQGLLPRAPRQTAQSGLPLLLLPEEVHLAVSVLRVAELVEGEDDVNEEGGKEYERFLERQYLEQVEVSGEKRWRVFSFLRNLLSTCECLYSTFYLIVN